MSGGEKLEGIRREMGLLERLISRIPGYRGYKEKELRRESDRLVRMEAVGKLRDAKNALRRSLANPFTAKRLSDEDSWRLNALMSRLDRVVQRLDRAVAGYAGLFDSVKVKEDKLDAVLQHDVGLIEKAEAIRSCAEALAGMELGSGDWRRELESLSLKVDEMDSLIDKRANLLRGLVD
ncbi:MAG: hypothetical protein QFX33_00520 [Candidatus Nezhaarchaeota archaeon]|nr:hypothetical protein [Candidatus Nezhaarchaeota archaeon]